jgi:regulator of protease activity HflC (stomatin/prohibitin superfamily)
MATHQEVSNAWFWFLVKGGIAGVAILALAMWGLPQYRVYNQRMTGAAAFAEAQQNRQILIQQAQAELDASKKRAEAIKIMGQAAKDFPEYRQQEFMASFGEALRDGNISQIIYVPTDGNIPVMEATRLQQPAVAVPSKE